MIFRAFLPLRGFKDQPGGRNLAFCASLAHLIFRQENQMGTDSPQMQKISPEVVEPRATPRIISIITSEMR